MKANDMSAADPDGNEDSFIPPAETDAYPDPIYIATSRLLLVQSG